MGGFVAKRFTDTGKWDKASFQELTPKLKLVWIFLCDKCDHAGVWDINLNLMSFQIGFDVTIQEIIEGFGDKVELKSSTKLFIPDFIEFQYGTLNPNNRVHQSVIFRLEKLAPSKDLKCPLQGDKDKDKDKDKVKDIKGGVGENFPAPGFYLEHFYETYPNKVNKAEGLRRLAPQMKTETNLSEFKTAIENYKRFLGLEKNKTWMQAKQWDVFVGAPSKDVKPWHEWINPDASVFEDSAQSKNPKHTRASIEDLESVS